MEEIERDGNKFLIITSTYRWNGTSDEHTSGQGVKPSQINNDILSQNIWLLFESVFGTVMYSDVFNCVMFNVYL